MNKAQPSQWKQVSWLATLVLSLLFAQFAGLQHRVEHAGWEGNLTRPLTDKGAKSASHSCAVFDAATLADGVQAAGVGTPFTECVYALTAHRLHLSWDASALVPFLSRAPPFMVI